MDRDDALREIYGADPDDFVATRNAVAARLKEDDPELAAKVKALRKPSIVVWAVNRTAQQNPELVEHLIEAGAALRTALSESPGDVPSLTKERRSLLRSITDAAAEVLSEAGSNAGAGNMDRISTTFLVASGDDDAAPLLRAGILAGELRSSELSGFGDLGEMDLAPEPDDAKARARSKEEAKVALRELERTAAMLELEADDAEAAARKARRAATEARAEAEKAASAADD